MSPAGCKENCVCNKTAYETFPSPHPAPNILLKLHMPCATFFCGGNQEEFISSALGGCGADVWAREILYDRIPSYRIGQIE